MRSLWLRNPKRELQWAWYKFLCHLQHQSVMESFYQIETIKQNGKIADRIDGRNESFDRNFYNFLGQNMLGVQPSTYAMGAYGEGSLVMKDTGGTDRTGQQKMVTNTNAYADAEALQDTLNKPGVRGGANILCGIVFDQSDTAYTFEQTAGVTPVLNGTGANQLIYGDTFLPYQAYDAGADKWTCTWERIALNSTLGLTTVDVKSICLYISLGGLGANYVFMLARDLLGGTITVPYNSQIKGRWVLTHDR